MPGGLIQLAAYGSENEYLNGNPQMTFFKLVFKRFTNFSMEFIKIPFEGPSELDVVNKIKLQARITRNADLINKMYFSFNLPDIYSGYNPETNIPYKFQWIKNIGTNIIEHIEIIIGGQTIDKHYGEWLNVWSELNVPDSQRDGYNYLIGNVPELYDPENNPGFNGMYPTSTIDENLNVEPEFKSIEYLQVINPFERPPSIRKRRIYVPLRFWFCQTSGLALPLIALQYHEVYVNIELKPVIELYTILDTDSKNTTFKKRVKPNPLLENERINTFIVPGSVDDEYQRITAPANLYNGWGLLPNLDINYIFLDDVERKKFAKITHEYLITQVVRNQFMGVNGTKSLNLVMQHPVKQIVWTTKRNDQEKINIYNNYTNWYDEDMNPNSTSWVNELFDIHESDYELLKRDIPNKFTSLFYNKDIIKDAKILFDGKERIASKDNIYFNYLESYNTSLRIPKTGIYSYSFELENSKFQPNGSCNMSRIRKITLEVNTNSIQTSMNSSGELEYNYLYDINVYSINYNILRFMAGMSGLSFSN